MIFKQFYSSAFIPLSIVFYATLKYEICSYYGDIYIGKEVQASMNPINRIKSCPERTISLIHINQKHNSPRTQVGFFFKYDMEHVKDHGHPAITGNDYVFLHPKIGETKFLQWTNEIDCIFTNFKDVYVSGSGMVSGGKTIIFSGNATGPAQFYLYWAGPVVKHVMTGIALHHNINNFGHFVADALYPLMALPIEFLKASTIIHPKGQKFVNEIFTWLDLDDVVLYVHGGDWVHCDSLISATHPIPHVCHFGPLPYKLSVRLRERMNLTSIEPHLYGIVQRSTNARVVTNVKECIAALKARVPDIDWQIFDEILNDLYASAKLHASLKVYGTVCGSNSFKVIFMSSKSVAVFVNTWIWDYSSYLSATSIGVKLVWFLTKEWEHTIHHNHDVDPERFAKAFEVAAYYAANGKWPDPTQYDAYIDALYT